MKIRRRLLNKAAALAAAVLWMILPAAGLGEAGDAEPAESSVLTIRPLETDINPAMKSDYFMTGHENCYWCMPMNIADEEAVWKMLTADMTVVDIDQKKQTVIYAEPDENSEMIGMVTGASQGVHVLEERDDGWTQIETYSTSFHDSKVKNYNAFVTGYIQSSKLKTVSVNQTMGIVVDKLTQRLYFFMDGKLVTELAVSTGKYNSRQPYNETRSGEFQIISVNVGRITSDDLICDCALRYNADDYLHEVPYVANADGSKNYKAAEPKLGVRASHGCIRTQRLTNAEGYNMRTIYKLIRDTTKKTGKNVKLVIWEDYAGRLVKIPDSSLQVYYNPNGGVNYHKCAECNGVKAKFLPLTAISWSDLETEYTKMTPCPYCQPMPKLETMEAINQEHLMNSPGDVMSYWNQ